VNEGEEHGIDFGKMVMKNRNFHWILLCLTFLTVYLAPICRAREAATLLRRSDTYARVSAKEDPQQKLTEVNATHRKLFEDSGIDRSSLTYKMKIALRACYLLFTYLPVVCTSLLAYLSSVFRDVLWFKLLRRTVANSGAAFIKWGQWTSTRSDMFPEKFCQEMSKLQADAPKHSYAFTRQQIQLELGHPIEEIFDSFDTVPLASGSIAQVHRAVLRGEVVAVKVRHPNVEMQIQLDFDIMDAVARFIDSVPGLDWINLTESMAQFSHTIAAQTDLTVEGHHLNIFRRNFRNLHQHYEFPDPIVATKSVLIESFLPGQSVAQLIERLKEISSIRDKREAADLESLLEDVAHFVVTKGEDLYLKMLLQDNLMHADLHPGNILVELKPPRGRGSLGAEHQRKHQQEQFGEEGVGIKKAAKMKTGRSNKRLTGGEFWDFDPTGMNYRIGLVDAGMVAELTASEKRNFVGLIEAIGEGAGMEAANCVLQFSSVNQEGPYLEVTRRHHDFQSDMVELFSRVARGYGTNVDLGEVLRGVLNLVRINRVTIDANYATLVMNALCLDGLAKDLMPSYNVIDGAKPLLRLNRRTKHLPLGLAAASLHFLFPVLRRMKVIFDRRFLNRLKQGLTVRGERKYR